MTPCNEFLGPMTVDIYVNGKKEARGSLYDFCCDNERSQEQYADAFQCLKNDCPYSWLDLSEISLVRVRPSIQITKNDGEYRVAPKISTIQAKWKLCREAAREHQENEAYYTDDKEDAERTAQEMEEYYNLAASSYLEED